MKTVLLIITLLSVATSSADAAKYYVRISGKDANDGKSAGKAFRTLDKAASVATAGDTIYVGGGTYDDVATFDGIDSSNGTPLLLIGDKLGTFTGDSGTVTLGAGARLSFIRCKNVEVRDFRFQGSTSRSFEWRRSTDGLVKKCVFSGATNGVKIRSGDVRFLECTIENSIYDGIEVFGSAELTLDTCVVKDCGAAGVEVNTLAKVSLSSCTITGNIGSGIVVSTMIPTDDKDIDRSPEEMLEDARDILKSTTPITDKGKKEIEKAVEELIKHSFDPDHWYDDWHPDFIKEGDGKKVFEGAEEAADQILKLLPLDKDPDEQAKKKAEHGVTPQVEAQLRNALNLLYQSSKLMAEIAYDEAVKGGGDEDDYEEAEEEFEESLEELEEGKWDKAIDKLKKAWEESVKAGGWAQGTINYEGGNDNDNPPNGQQDRKLAIRATTIEKNDSGIRCTASQNLDVRDCTIRKNAKWGLRLVEGAQLKDCQISTNGSGGVWVVDGTDAQLSISNLTLSANVDYGVFFDNCNVTVNSSKVSEWGISGSKHTFAGDSSTVTFNGVTISEGSVAGLYFVDSTLSVLNSTIQNAGYGVATDKGTLLIKDSNIQNNSTGVYVTDADTATVQNSTVTGSSAYGLSFRTSGLPGAVVTIDNCNVHTNFAGIYLQDAEDGDFVLKNTTIRDNSDTGLHLFQCTMMITDQPTRNWTSLRNKYGLSANASTLTLSNLTVSDSSSYALHLVSSNVTGSKLTTTGRDGVYSGGANAQLTLTASRFKGTASGVGNHGIYRTRGNATLKNCLIYGFDNGIYLNTSALGDQATINNCTIDTGIGNGIHSVSGYNTVVNCIVTGSNGASGLTGNMTHTYNLIHGFTTPISGSSAHDSEVFAKPRFADPLAGDYRLASGSPAINAGTDLGAQVPTDLDGNTRPLFRAFDIGAFEYTSNTGSFRILTWSEQR